MPIFNEEKKISDFENLTCDCYIGVSCEYFYVKCEHCEKRNDLIHWLLIHISNDLLDILTIGKDSPKHT